MHVEHDLTLSSFFAKMAAWRWSGQFSVVQKVWIY